MVAILALLVIVTQLALPNLLPVTQAVGASPSLDVWWPADGAVINGVQPFKVMLKDADVGNYTAYWQVDGDRLNAMPTSLDGYPHKETTVDLSGWTWRGSGPYVITFVAKDAAGNVLATRSVNIRTGDGAGASSSQASSSSSLSLLQRLSSFRKLPSASATPYPSLSSVASSSLSSLSQPSSVASSAAASSAPAVTSSPHNVFTGARFYVNPQNDAAKQAEAWKSSRPQDAQTILKIAQQPETFWMGNWNPDIAGDARKFADIAINAGALPVFVLYNIPQRDCGGYSAGGANGGDAYRAWVRGFAEGIGSRKAAVLVEPDALAGMDCLSEQDRETRMQLLRETVQTLKSKPGMAVYIDAGHAAWKSADDMASRLTKAGIDMAEGFSLNVSNFETDADTVRYGTELSQKTGGKHFVYDAGRNGAGPAPDRQWCNPPDRALGQRPTVNTGNALVDAVLWVKGPGGSDGSCNGAPSAGQWYPEYALGLAQRARW
ncbi:MAG: glycoside hydrolase family 6 protein [Candidatus Peribacteraceae bacterium]|jgi:endoglucanase